MKKIILPLLFFCAALNANAQEYLHINSHWHEGYVSVDEIDSITTGTLTYCNMLPAIMAKDPNISIFNAALELTHMCDSMVEAYDYNFQQGKGITYPYSFQNATVAGLSEIKKGYTAFVETDSVYAAHGIFNLKDLKAYAASVYDEMYPEDASITDPTDRRNSLNRFVSYHLLDIKAEKNKLTVAGMIDRYGNELKNKYLRDLADIADWYETMMPHSLLKCSSPLLSSGKETVFINRRGVGEKPVRDIFVKGAEITNSKDMILQGEALNGSYHYIDDIIAYDKQTQKVVLDEQIIINEATLLPEIINNGLRNPYNGFSNISGIYDNGIRLPNWGMKNIKVYNADTQIHYLQNYNWADYQTDEMLVNGNFDFSIKLPSVPAGTYELNIGCGAHSIHPLVVCYLNEEFCDTIDTRYDYEKYARYWISDKDLGTPEAIAQNDSLLFANGYRKGLDFHLAYTTTMRDFQNSMRAIVTTFTTDGKSDYYLRIRSVESYRNKEFNLDYLELCPTHLLKEYK